MRKGKLRIMIVVLVHRHTSKGLNTVPAYTTEDRTTLVSAIPKIFETEKSFSPLHKSLNAGISVHELEWEKVSLKVDADPPLLLRATSLLYLITRKQSGWVEEWRDAETQKFSEAQFSEINEIKHIPR